jgi:AraC-like DNA-binding protein
MKKKKKRFNRLTLQSAKTYKEKLDRQYGYEDCTEKASAQPGIGRNTLQKAFKKKYGQTIREYKLKLRMDRSIELLHEGKDVKQVSVLVRYTTPRAFSHAFKKHFGILPSDYSRRYVPLK